MNLKTEIKGMVSDWYKYMNTSIPKGVNGQVFTELIYSNREKKINFLDKHKEIDVRVLENIALHEFLQKSDKEILNKILTYHSGEQ